MGAAVVVGFVTAGPARSQLGVAKNYVQVQSATPGTSQSGHANLSGTMRAGSFIGDGSGLTGLSSGQLSLPMIRSMAYSTSMTGIIDITNTAASGGITAIHGTSSTPNSAGLIGTAGPAPSGIPGTMVGVLGRSTSGNGVFGYSVNSIGVLGSGPTGVLALTIGTDGIALDASAGGTNSTGVRSTGTAFAGVFNGNVHLNGATTVGPTFVPATTQARLYVGSASSTQFEGIAAVSGANGNPFYGYMNGSTLSAYTHFNPVDDTLRTYVGGTRMIVTRDGNVGIGSLMPGQRLHVQSGQIWSDWDHGPSSLPNVYINNGLAQSLTSLWKFGMASAVGTEGGAGSTHVAGAFYVAGGTSENRGVIGAANQTSTGTNIGIWGYAASGATNWSGYFSGNLYASSASSGVKAFLIDHPDDPENMYLEHSSIESNERMNLYRGRVVTDGSGYANITVPNWFLSLNGDIQYQLTVIDQADRDDFVMAKVVQEIRGGAFRIRTSAPKTTVCWQLSGVRIDPVARAYPLEVEREKPAHERGKLLFPEAYGRPTSEGLYGPDGLRTTVGNAKSSAP